MNIRKLMIILLGITSIQLVNAQFFDATLELADGSIINGGVQPKWHKIVFKVDGGKARTYMPDEIRQFTIHDKRYPADTLHYRFEKKKVDKAPWLLNIWEEGAVNLYGKISGAIPGLDMYYLLKKSGDEVVKDVHFITSGGSIMFPKLKKISLEHIEYYFGDYPNLIVNGTLNPEFKDKDLREFVIEYNAYKKD